MAGHDFDIQWLGVVLAVLEEFGGENGRTGGSSGGNGRISSSSKLYFSIDATWWVWKN